MSKINLGRVIKALDYFSPNQLAQIRDEIDQRLTPSPTAITSNETYSSGWNNAWFIVGEYLGPVIDEMSAINMAAGQIVGIALAGYGQLPKEQLRKLAGVMSNHIARLDYSVSSAKPVIDMTDHLDLSFVRNLYEAGKRYYSGEDPQGDEIRLLAANANRVTADLVNLRTRRGLRPGRSPDEWLNNRIVELYEANTGTHQQVGLVILKELQEKETSDPILIEARAKLENIPYNKLGDTIRQRYNRYKRA